MTPRVEHLAEGVEVWLGDCREVLPGLGRADAIITDPPYAIPTQVASGRSITRSVGDLSIVEGAFREHASLWKTAVREVGRIFVFCDGASYPVIYRAAYGHFNLASLIWDKQQIGMGREFRKRHELIVHGWGGSTPVVPSDGIGHADVLQCRPVSGAARQHPAEKPIGLLTDLLRVCGDVIIDPFAGSGSTGVAAITQGRKFKGIEIEPRWFDIACRRIDAVVRGLHLGVSDDRRAKQEALAL